MGSHRGAVIIAAAKIGCTPEEWHARRANGQRWCSGCRTWHSREEFGFDKSKWDRVPVRCRAYNRKRTAARRAHVKHRENQLFNRFLEMARG